MWVVYVSSFDKIYFTGWVWKIWASLLSHFSKDFSQIPSPTQYLSCKQTWRPNFPGPLKIAERGCQNVTERAGAVEVCSGTHTVSEQKKCSPTLGRALVSWTFAACHINKDSDQTLLRVLWVLFLTWSLFCLFLPSTLLGLQSPVLAWILLSQFGDHPCPGYLTKFLIPHFWYPAPWLTFSKNAA